MSELLGRYHLLRCLARGGMAEVWLAELKSADGFGRKVAIKRIHPHLAEDVEFIDMLRSEARLGMQLTHPNIVGTLEFADAGGTWFLAMEYVQGASLAQLIRHAQLTGAEPTLGMSLEVLVQLVSALEYAQTATDPYDRPLGLIHRDIKPANMLIDRAGTVKLADFGIARAVTNIKHTETTGIRKGTLPYMAPEQARADKEIDGRADLYAVGLIAFELFTGQRLHLDADSVPGMLRIMQGEVADRLPLLARLHLGAIEDVVLKLLHPLPDARYQSAEQLLHALLPLYAQAQLQGASRQALGQWVKGYEGLGTQQGLHVHRPTSKPSSGSGQPVRELPPAPHTIDRRQEPQGQEALTDPGRTAWSPDGQRPSAVNITEQEMTTPHSHPKTNLADRTQLSDPTRRVDAHGPPSQPERALLRQPLTRTAETVPGNTPPPVMPSPALRQEIHPGVPAAPRAPQHSHPPAAQDMVSGPAAILPAAKAPQPPGAPHASAGTSAFPPLLPTPPLPPPVLESASARPVPEEPAPNQSRGPGFSLLVGALGALGVLGLIWGLWPSPATQDEPSVANSHTTEAGVEATRTQSSSSSPVPQQSIPKRSPSPAGPSSTAQRTPPKEAQPAGQAGPSSASPDAQTLGTKRSPKPPEQPTRTQPASTPMPEKVQAASAPVQAAQGGAGFLKVNSDPPSSVYWKGRLLGETPLLGVELPAGSHVLTFRTPSGQETSRQVEIKPGQTHKEPVVRFR